MDTLIETVLEQEPMHPGAHHYRIHLWDGVKPLVQMRRLRSTPRRRQVSPTPGTCPDIPTPGSRRYADAAFQQEGSARVDHAYMFRDRVLPFEIHNYAHNNQWLCTSYSHIGRVRDAIAVARNLVEQPRDPEKKNVHDGGSAQRSGRIRWTEVLTRYELWDDLIAATARARSTGPTSHRAQAKGLHFGPRPTRPGATRRSWPSKSRRLQEEQFVRGESRARRA